ncbi:MAG: DNA gyrase C-terminal beta-propeller domain-containing protein, partial [bacterium]
MTLKRVVAFGENDGLVVASSTGRLLRLAVNESNLPVMGRTAQGPQLMRLLPGEEVVGAASVPAAGEVLLASRRGQLKKLQIHLNLLLHCLKLRKNNRLNNVILLLKSGQM